MDSPTADLRHPRRKVSGSVLCVGVGGNRGDRRGFQPAPHALGVQVDREGRRRNDDSTNNWKTKELLKTALGIRGTALVCCCLLLAALHGQTELLCSLLDRIGARLRALSTALVYRKMLTLSSADIGEAERRHIADVNNLVSNDCQKFLDLLPILNLVWGKDCKEEEKDQVVREG